MDATQEEWRPVVGFENTYEVSSLGRVRSLDRIIKAHKAGKVYSVRRNGVMLSPGHATSGHLNVVLQGKITRTVHSLVAEAFIGPRPDGYEIRHLNGQPADCRAANLRYGTRSENAEDSKRHGTHFHAGLTHCKRGHELTGDNLQKVGTRNRRVCLACRRERAQLYRAGTQVTTNGLCINGHPMTPENRYTNGTGHTRCKPCVRERNAD